MGVGGGKGERERELRWIAGGIVRKRLGAVFERPVVGLSGKGERREEKDYCDAAHEKL